MTYPPKGSAPPVAAAPALPAVPSQAPPPAAPAGSAPSGLPPARRSARAEAMDRMRAAAVTEPGRLRLIAGVLALLIAAFGAVTSVQMADRSAAADDVLLRSQPLSSDAASIYRSLAHANTAASSGFLAGGQEPADVRKSYEDNIDLASKKLVAAASSTDGTSRSAELIAELNRLLPVYTDRISTARANNRQGLPLGGAWLRNANELMQDEMLPKAGSLYAAEKARLRADYDDAESYPWAALGLGVLAVGSLVWAQRRNYRRTNRVFNHGLVAATAASTVVLLWLAVGHTVARSGLSDSYDHGVRSLNVLNDARIASLNARGAENLTLVARGAVTIPEGRKNAGDDAYDVDHRTEMALLDGAKDGKEEGYLDRALALADDAEGREPLRTAATRVAEWKDRHAAARAKDDTGDYDGALDKVIGDAEDKPTGESFRAVDSLLEKALSHEQREFEQAAQGGRGAMSGLVAGSLVLAVLGVAGAGLGIARRLSEYR